MQCYDVSLYSIDCTYNSMSMYLQLNICIHTNKIVRIYNLVSQFDIYVRTIQYLYLQAAGYGIVYFAKKMLADKGISLEGKRCLITGSDSVSTDTAVCTCWLILLCNDYFCLDAIKRFFSSHLFGGLYFVFCLFFFVFYFTSFCVFIIMFILFYYFILLVIQE